MTTATLVSSPLLVERLPNGRRQLARDLVIDLGVDVGLGDAKYPGFTPSPQGTTVVTVRAGFDTDYSSIPWFARALYRFDEVDLAGIAHDWAYRVGVPRDVADRIWRLVAESGEPSVGSALGWIGWAGLRLGGWAAYRARARERAG